MNTDSSTSPASPVLVLVGPTASGKTALLDELFGSRSVSVDRSLPPVEVVSADSMQAYRGMDIGTAKPGPELLERLPHRLIDILEPSERYTAGDFVRLADAECAAIAARGALPLVSGGTGFYVRNFICGLPRSPAADPAIRAGVASDLRLHGRDALRRELAASDPASAVRIHPNDEYRLTRALEIIRATGQKLEDFAPGVSPRSLYRFLVVGVERDRAEIGARIEARVAAMIAAGLPEEYRRLRAEGYGRASPGMEAIGYREFLEAGEGESIESIASRIVLDTKRYAKRQMTFFRSLPGIRWIAPDAGALGSLLAAFLAP